MQYDMARFDQPLVDDTQPKAHVWTDIGDAEVEYSIFGNAKVRVYRQKDEVRGALRWTLLSMSLVIGAVWLVSDASRQPEIVRVAAPKPVVVIAKPEPQTPVRVLPQIKPQVTPPIATTKPVPQLQASSAPVAAKLLLRAPVVVSGASAAVLAKPAASPVAVTTKPLAPAAITPEVFQAPIDVSSAVKATN
jgi:hypothetical protein